MERNVVRRIRGCIAKAMRRDKMRHRYNFSLFGAFNSLSCGITATMSFSSAISLPFLLITTVALALLLDVRKNLLDADHRTEFFQPSFISTPSASDGNDGGGGGGSASIVT
jgi:hypothetical protein